MTEYKGIVIFRFDPTYPAGKMFSIRCDQDTNQLSLSKSEDLGFLDDIKQKTAKYLLDRASAVDREVVAVNIQDAKSIGIIYRADHDETNELVRRYVKFLKDYKLKVKALGYFDKKELPPDVNPKLEFDFITKKDLNLRLEPKSVVARNFVEEAFDILIDTSVSEDVIMQYLTHYSKAKFKVGATRLSYHNQLDLSIVLKPEEGTRQLLKGVDKYLHVIKN